VERKRITEAMELQNQNHQVATEPHLEVMEGAADLVTEPHLEGTEEVAENLDMGHLHLLMVLLPSLKGTEEVAENLDMGHLHLLMVLLLLPVVMELHPALVVMEVEEVMNTEVDRPEDTAAKIYNLLTDHQEDIALEAVYLPVLDTDLHLQEDNQVAA